MEVKFYRCRHCGNVVVKTVDSGVPVECCGEPMEELEAQTNEMGMEKHVPVVEQLDDCTLRVKIGSNEHPMLPAHYIQFVYLLTEVGGRVVFLKPGDKPEVEFCCCKSKPLAVYEYCNIHGLWIKKL